MLLATAGTLAANIISKEIAANTIMVTKTTHNPITGRRDPLGANGVFSWKIFVERFTAFLLKQRFRGFSQIPSQPVPTQHAELCSVASTLARGRAENKWKTNRGHRISSNITAKAVDSGICGTDNQLLKRCLGSSLLWVSRGYGFLAVTSPALTSLATGSDEPNNSVRFNGHHF